MQVSDYGSVKVEKLMNVERYSHVMHISSTVRFYAFEFDDILTCKIYLLLNSLLYNAVRLVPFSLTYISKSISLH